jgi:hypothetical protein
VKPTILATWVAGCALFAVSIATAAQAQTVTFSNINDAVPEKYFDSATTRADELNPNRLIIGFNSGFNSKTWVNTQFTASTASFFRRQVMDTISFLITAPEGYYISKITYIQSGSGGISRTGSAAGS